MAEIGKMFYKICAALFMVMVLALTGCSTADTAAENAETETETMQEYLASSCYDFRDPETGVHYIIYNAYNRSGITVRYNADGSLYVD